MSEWPPAASKNDTISRGIRPAGGMGGLGGNRSEGYTYVCRPAVIRGTRLRLRGMLNLCERDHRSSETCIGDSTEIRTKRSLILGLAKEIDIFLQLLPSALEPFPFSLESSRGPEDRNGPKGLQAVELLLDLQLFVDFHIGEGNLRLRGIGAPSRSHARYAGAGGRLRNRTHPPHQSRRTAALEFRCMHHASAAMAPAHGPEGGTGTSPVDPDSKRTASAPIVWLLNIAYTSSYSRQMTRSRAKSSSVYRYRYMTGPGGLPWRRKYASPYVAGSRSNGSTACTSPRSSQIRSTMWVAQGPRSSMAFVAFVWIDSKNRYRAVRFASVGPKEAGVWNTTTLARRASATARVASHPSRTGGVSRNPPYAPRASE